MVCLGNSRRQSASARGGPGRGPRRCGRPDLANSWVSHCYQVSADWLPTFLIETPLPFFDPLPHPPHIAEKAPSPHSTDVAGGSRGSPVPRRRNSVKELGGGVLHEPGRCPLKLDSWRAEAPIMIVKPSGPTACGARSVAVKATTFEHKGGSGAARDRRPIDLDVAASCWPRSWRPSAHASP